MGCVGGHLVHSLCWFVLFFCQYCSVPLRFKLFIGVALTYFDLGSDVYVAWEYFTNGWSTFGAIAVVFIVIPLLGLALYNGVILRRGWQVRKKNPSILNKHLFSMLFLVKCVLLCCGIMFVRDYLY